MRIYTITQLQLYKVTREIIEPQYVENIPYSLQQKLNIPQRISIRYYKGKPFIYCGVRREIYGEKANRIIRILNGYAKENNKVLFR